MKNNMMNKSQLGFDQSMLARKLFAWAVVFVMLAASMDMCVYYVL